MPQVELSYGPRNGSRGAAVFGSTFFLSEIWNTRCNIFFLLNQKESNLTVYVLDFAVLWWRKSMKSVWRPLGGGVLEQWIMKPLKMEILPQDIRECNKISWSLFLHSRKLMINYVSLLRPKNKCCVSTNPTDPNFRPIWNCYFLFFNNNLPFVCCMSTDPKKFGNVSGNTQFFFQPYARVVVPSMFIQDRYRNW